VSQRSPKWKTIAHELANETDPQKALALSLQLDRALDANNGNLTSPSEPRVNDETFRRMTAWDST
jgi:hypothetical protein